VIDLLDRLYRDPYEMVCRSIANNLNDIARDNPGIVVATLARWRAGRETDETFQRLAGHALRTLLKRTDRGESVSAPEKRLAPGESLRVERTHSFRPYKNQRFYDGTHALEIEIDGRRSCRTEFSLTT
jgi:hypothetical protein